MKDAFRKRLDDRSYVCILDTSERRCGAENSFPDCRQCNIPISASIQAILGFYMGVDERMQEINAEEIYEESE